MYAKNVVTFLRHLIKDGKLEIDLSDEITRETLLTRDGQVTHARLRSMLNLEPLPDPAAESASPPPETPPRA